MVDENKICPYKLILKKIDGPGLKATIKNVSDKLQVFICENYWHPTRICIMNKDGIEIKWENIYPPVEPPPPTYYFLNPKEEHVTNEENFHINHKYTIHWAEAQLFNLEPGIYYAYVRWECFYGVIAIYDTHSYEQTYMVNRELDKQWVGHLKSNFFEFELPDLK